MSSTTRRFDLPPFVFDAESGELSRDGHESTRLQPQPARLLALLAERRGEVVTHEEIREELWPDTQVDYEQGVRFCVRQIRAALADSASEPHFLETLPRRGYRLLIGAADANPTVPPHEGVGTKPAGGSHQLLVWILAALALPVFTSGVWLLLRAPSTDSSLRSPLESSSEGRPGERGVARLAVMPFGEAAPEDMAEWAAPFSDVAGYLVASFGNDDLDDIELIGPSTTHRFLGERFPQLERLRDELEADYVLNAFVLGRESDQGDGPSSGELLIELIRLADGAHPWVRRFPLESAADPENLAVAIEEGVRSVLGEREPARNSGNRLRVLQGSRADSSGIA